MTKKEVLKYLSNLGSVQTYLKLLSSGNLKVWEKKEFFEHLSAVFVERGINISPQNIELKLSQIENSNSVKTTDISEILSVLNSKL